MRIKKKVSFKSIALGFEAGHPLGEDSVKSQAEKWIPVLEDKHK